MRRATPRRFMPIHPLIPAVVLGSAFALPFTGCQPAPTSGPVVLPSGGPQTFRPTPTPVPGSSEIPSQAPGNGNGPEPTVQVPPPIP